MSIEFSFLFFLLLINKMDITGDKTKHLLSSRIKHIQQAYKKMRTQEQDYVPRNKKYDMDTLNTNFGNISNIQLPYEIQQTETEGEEREDGEEPEEDTNETFSSYVLYFIIILISLGIIGYHLANQKILSIESINGITMGLLIGLIIMNLLWSSIKDKKVI